MNKFKLIGAGLFLVIATILCFTFIEFKTVKGGELGVMETWNDGVVDEVLQPKNYYLFPGFSKEIFTYDTRLLVSELSDYKIKSADNQEMTIRSKVQWRRDPSKLVKHHKTYKQDAERIAIEPAMISAILRHGTVYKALDAYSGEGLIRMQNDIAKDLMANKQLQEDGIIIESFIILYNHLNSEYLETINTRQLAALRQTAAVEKQKAAEAEALVAKAEAQANLNKIVVEAERDKQVKVLAAQADNERAILAAEAANKAAVLAAEAEQKKLILEAEGKRQSAIAEAEGLTALGKAKAESQKLLLESYAVKGSESYTRIEVSKNFAQAFSGIKGYVSEKMTINVMSDSFYKGLDLATGSPIVAPTVSSR